MDSHISPQHQSYSSFSWRMLCATSRPLPSSLLHRFRGCFSSINSSFSRWILDLALSKALLFSLSIFSISLPINSLLTSIIFLNASSRCDLQATIFFPLTCLKNFTILSGLKPTASPAVCARVPPRPMYNSGIEFVFGA